ncbi:MAG: hypothetical protein RR035_03300 [Oscillibacter sp.]
MKTTTNYHLNQWDPGDRLLRTDFNGDNGKIDAAIHAAENRISSFSNQLSNTVSNVNSQISSAISTVDNKITALENRTGTRLLRDVTTTATATSVDFYLNDMDWNAWSAIYIRLDPITTTGNVLQVSINRNANLSIAYGNTDSVHNEFALYALYPLYDRRHIVTGLSLTAVSTNMMSISARYQNITTLTVQGLNSTPVAPGTNMKLWGVN